jgi:hypothetical protein
LVRWAWSIDAPVGQHALGHLDRPRAFRTPGKELAADGIAHVVREQGEAFDAQCGHEGGGHVRLQRNGVGPVGLGGQPVPGHVEQQDPPPVPQAVEHGGVVEGRRREPVQDEEGCMSFGADGRRVHGEDDFAAQRAWRAEGLPLRAGADGHVPASLATTGPSVSQASDSIDQ